MFFPNRRTALSYLMLLLPPLALTVLAFVTLARLDQLGVVAGAPLDAIPIPTPVGLQQALAHTQTGAAHQARGDWAAAEQAYQAALAVDPALAVAYAALGSLYVARERPADAVVMYKQAVALEPGAAEWWRNLGVIQANLDAVEAAVAALEKAISLSPEEAKWHYELGQIYAFMQRSQEVRRAFIRVLVLTPEAALRASAEEQLRLLASELRTSRHPAILLHD